MEALNQSNIFVINWQVLVDITSPEQDPKYLKKDEFIETGTI